MKNTTRNNNVKENTHFTAKFVVRNGAKDAEGSSKNLCAFVAADMTSAFLEGLHSPIPVRNSSTATTLNVTSTRVETRAFRDATEPLFAIAGARPLA